MALREQRTAWKSCKPDEREFLHNLSLGKMGQGGWIETNTDTFRYKNLYCTPVFSIWKLNKSFRLLKFVFYAFWPNECFQPCHAIIVWNSDNYSHTLMIVIAISSFIKLAGCKPRAEIQDDSAREKSLFPVELFNCQHFLVSITRQYIPATNLTCWFEFTVSESDFPQTGKEVFEWKSPAMTNPWASLTASLICWSNFVLFLTIIWTGKGMPTEDCPSTSVLISSSGWTIFMGGKGNLVSMICKSSSLLLQQISG